MTCFRVWAPHARQRVTLVLGQRRLAMERRAGDWWERTVAAAGPGTDYAFALDDGPPLPDPRSPWQPAGVDGPSRTVDQAAYRWGDGDWQAPPLAAAVIYELHIGTFTPAGTFEAAIERLDALVELGISHIELMPVAEFPGRRGWGYDGVDLFAPYHGYGGPLGLKRLVDAAHQRGLAVLLDVVYNHLGPAGNVLGAYAPYFSDRHQTPWGAAVNLDGPDSDEVRRFLIDNALMWLRDYHLDGLRLDAVHALIDLSAVHLLEELAGAVDRLAARLGRQLVLIAESDLNDPRLVRPPLAGGYGLDAQWSDDFHHALHSWLTGERAGYYADFGRLADLASVYEQNFLYTGQYAPSRRRRHGRPPTGLAPTRFLGYLQNHDQIGNRAAGERSSQLLSPARLKIGAALVLLAPFVPLLFMGEEWGASTPFLYFTDHQEPALAEAVSVGRRQEFTAFGWAPAAVPDPQAPATFARSVLDWAEQARPPHAELLDWHRRLIALRRDQPAALDGRPHLTRARCDEAAGWLSLVHGGLQIVVNGGAAEQSVPLTEPAASWRLALASGPGIRLAGDGVAERIVLPPDTVAVLRRD